MSEPSPRGLQIDCKHQRIVVDGRTISLTKLEWKVLQFLALNAGKVCSREALVQAVYGTPYCGKADDQRLDALFVRLRKKIERNPRAPRFIITVYGQGHQLNEYLGEIEDS